MPLAARRPFHEHLTPLLLTPQAPFINARRPLQEGSGNVACHQTSLLSEPDAPFQTPEAPFINARGPFQEGSENAGCHQTPLSSTLDAPDLNTTGPFPQRQKNLSGRFGDDAGHQTPLFQSASVGSADFSKLTSCVCGATL